MTSAEHSEPGLGMAASFGERWLPEGELTSAQPGDRLPPVGEVGTLVSRLRGVYGVGPGDPPEFGFRGFSVPPIQHAAANRIVSLEDRVATLEAECVAWRKAWDGREEAEHAVHAYSDPDHQHDIEGHWDDCDNESNYEHAPCESCQRFLAIHKARAATGPIGGVA